MKIELFCARRDEIRNLLTLAAHKGQYRRIIGEEAAYELTLPADAELDPNIYVVSTRSYNLAAITQKDMEQDRYLLRKQVSNVLALRVLMLRE